MSKKHYITTANYLADRRLATRKNARNEIIKMALFLADQYAADNPRFNRETFLAVVGNGDASRVVVDG